MSLSSEAKRKKANKDERRRMKRLKEAYDELQSYLPRYRGRPQRCLPKVEILRQATEYIQTLDKILNFPFLLPSNGSESHPRSTKHVTTDRTQLQTQNDSSRLTKNENQLFASEKTQLGNFFQMAFERKERFSSNSVCSAALALKQMAEESKKQVSHENALSFYPPSRGMNPSIPHPESSSSLSYCEKTLSPSDCFSSSNLISDVIGINDENVDSDEYQTDDGSTPALPYPCNCHSLPLRHLEVSEESVEQGETNPVKRFSTSQTKENESSHFMPLYSQNFDFQNLYHVFSTPDWSQAGTFLSHAQNYLDMQENDETLDFRLASETANFNPCESWFL